VYILHNTLFPNTDLSFNARDNVRQKRENKDVISQYGESK